MVITSLTRNQVAFTGTWVQIPPSPLYFKDLSAYDKSFFVGCNKVCKHAKIVHKKEKGSESYGKHAYM